MSDTVRKEKRTDFILIFDRYFSKKPSAVFSVLKRAFYAAAECICMTLCLLGIYRINADVLTVTGLCAFFTAVFCVVFSFVKKRFAIPAFALISGFIIYANREAVWDKLTYFIDAVFRALNGTVFKMNRYMWHKELSVNADSQILFSIIGVSCIIAVICAGAMFKKPSGAAPLTVFVVLFIPMCVAQKLAFNLWAVPTVALLLGGFAVSKAFSGGVITRGGSYKGCRKTYMREEHVFGTTAARAAAIDRAELNAVHYSKYFSAAVCAAAIFTASGYLGSVIMEGQMGIDYSGVYDFFSQFGNGTKEHTFDDDYDDFLDLGFFSGRIGSSLSVTAPKNSDREVLKVRNSGEEVYLRGDIGIIFEGTSWSSPMTSEASDAAKSLRYRPAEMYVLINFEEDFKNRFPDMYYSAIAERYISDGRLGLVRESDIDIEYISGTNIVFLPAYPASYSKYYDSMFYWDGESTEGYDRYGDFIVRSNTGDMETLECHAFVPMMNYTGYDAEGKEDLVAVAELINRLYDYPGRFDTAVVPDWSAANIYNEYKKYVLETYLDVPEEMRGYLTEFINENGLFKNTFNGNLVLEYRACVEVTDFLKDNYTYSLDTDNGREDPVMSFLTETKSGHCALYASAMTLMLRTAGIPARYCTGFIAPHTDNGEEAVIKTKNLHAWCEVFFDGIGWVTFDPTSASVYGDIEIVNSDDGEGNSDGSKNDDDEDSDNSRQQYEYDPGDDDEDDEGDGDITEPGSNSEQLPEENDESIDPMPFIIAGAFAAVIAAIIAFIVVKFKKLDKRAREMLEKAETFGGCEELYAKIIAILGLCGYSQKTGEQPERFFERVDGHFKTKLFANKEMLMKIAFGKDEFTDGELKETARLLNKLFEAADSQLVALGRVRLRRIIVSRVQN